MNNDKSFLYCSFCSQYYLYRLFQPHLNHCNEYIKYMFYQKLNESNTNNTQHTEQNTRHTPQQLQLTHISPSTTTSSANTKSIHTKSIHTNFANTSSANTSSANGQNTNGQNTKPTATYNKHRDPIKSNIEQPQQKPQPQQKTEYKPKTKTEPLTTSMVVYKPNTQNVQNRSNIQPQPQPQPQNINHTRDLVLYDRYNFENIIKQKRIIIVGPSSALSGSGLGKYIESFDIVVRLNKSLPIPLNQYNDIGMRTDILYNSLNTTDYPGENNIEPSFFLKNGVKYLRCSYPPIDPFKKDIIYFMKMNKNKIPFGTIDINYYIQIEHCLKSRPLTGTCAILDLLMYDIKELVVIGIDFYMNPYNSYYRKINIKQLKKLKNNGVHKNTSQIELLKRLYLLDNRFKTDHMLKNILLYDYILFFNKLKNNIIFEKTFQSVRKQKQIQDISQNSLFYKLYKLNQTINIYSNTNNIIKSKNSTNILICDNNLPQSTELSQYTELSADKLKYIHIVCFKSYNSYLKYLEYVGYAESLSNQIYLLFVPYDKNYILPKTDKQLNKNTEKNTDKKEQIYFINDLLLMYLKKCLLDKIIPSSGLVSFNLCVLIYFYSIFSNGADINTTCKNNLFSINSKSDYYNQKLLYLFLLKQKYIRHI